MSKPLVIVAVGGNALTGDNQDMTVLDQYRAAGETSSHIAGLVERGFRVLVTHGNGPQVGFILLRSELAKETLHQVPLESCVADTQGAVGYQVGQTLRNELLRRKLPHEVVSVVTQAVVDADDPAFQNPSKPIGPFYSEADAIGHRDNDGWHVIEDAGRGWRRVVPSPRPLEIIEQHAIRELLEHDIVVVAAGGGGVPVVRAPDGTLSGCPAVIDKDWTSALLAVQLEARVLVLATSVEKVALDFGTPDERPLDRMTNDEARRYLADGQFAPGSMGPKIGAALTFIEQGGRRVIITRPDCLEDVFDGTNGTLITDEEDGKTTPSA